MESSCKDHVQNGNVTPEKNGTVGDNGQLSCKPGFKPRVGKNPVLEKRNKVDVECVVNRYGNTVWVDNSEDMNQVFCEQGRITSLDINFFLAFVK